MNKSDMPIINRRRSIIPACDVSNLEKLKELVLGTCEVYGIGGYKVGLELSIYFGLKKAVEIIRQETDLPIIYDHQKGGTDIPDLGIKFAESVRLSGANAVILFPFGGRVTEIEWIKVCQDSGLGVIVGGYMTQPKFLSSEGGFIDDITVEKIYSIAANHGVRDFVVPGNKPEFVLKCRQLLEDIIGVNNFTLYAPGFITQGGDISETGKVAGEEFHAIVGSALYKKDDVEEIRKAAEELVRNLL